jgi:hypothetical protein
VPSTDDVRALEAALRARRDDATLAVYADALQANGDPRGDLIALDLHAERHGASTTLEERRERLIAWLGAPCCGGRWWRLRDFRHGFLVDYGGDAEAIAGLIASPAGRYIERLRVVDCAERIPTALASLASRSLPWLRYLVIERGLGLCEPLPRELLDALGAAAPRLDMLVLAGSRLVASPGIATVHTLSLEGCSALVLDGTPMPRVHTLVLLGEVEGESLDTLVSAKAFPALQCVDLARNVGTRPFWQRLVAW